MTISEIVCESILTRASGYLKGVCSHSANPFIGCGFGRTSCGVGCYVRFNPWLTRGREWGGFVDVKINAAEVYEKTFSREQSWARRRNGEFSIFLSSSTDPWQPAEKKYRVTRRLLEAMLRHPPDALVLQTHAVAIGDDLELIRGLSARCRLRVHVSVEGDADHLPGLPPPPCGVEDRLKTLAEFARAGVATVACLSPLYPLRDADGFFARLAACGARAAVIDHFIEGDGTPDGSRTLQTTLPEAMRRADPVSVRREYRDRIAEVARKYLPVGISCSGFAGKYS